MNGEYILVCSCHRMDKKASEIFSLMHPDRVLPKIIKGKDNIHKFAKTDGSSSEHIKALSKLTGRFAYYIKIENDKIVEEYDLLRRKRIA